MKRQITKETLIKDLNRQHFYAKEYGNSTVYGKPNCDIQFVIKEENFSVEDIKGEQLFITRFDTE